MFDISQEGFILGLHETLNENIEIYLVNSYMFNFIQSTQASGLLNQKTTTRQKRDQKIASLLILLVLVFGCCNVVRSGTDW